MILFLDFDGVLHPMLARHRSQIFCYLPRLENVLRDYPAVRLVIASAWRELVPLTSIIQRFSPDVAARIIGATPVFPVLDACDITGSRYREIQAYLNGRGDRWLVLDDDATLYPQYCAELLLCDDGFRDVEEKNLRQLLSAIH